MLLLFTSDSDDLSESLVPTVSTKDMNSTWLGARSKLRVSLKMGSLLPCTVGVRFFLRTFPDGLS